MHCIVSGGTETGLARNKQGSSRRTLLVSRESASWQGSRCEQGRPIGRRQRDLDRARGISSRQASRRSLALTRAVWLASDPQRRHAGREHRLWLSSRRFALLPADLRRRARGGRPWAARDECRRRLSPGAEADVACQRPRSSPASSFRCPRPHELVKLYKISKRKEIDTSTFRAGIRIDARGRPDPAGGHRLFGCRPDRHQAAADRELPGRTAVLRVDVSRGGQAGAGRGRADLGRPRQQAISIAARREYPGEVLS